MIINDHLIPREYVIKGSGKQLIFTNDPTSYVDEVRIVWKGKNMGKGVEHWAVMRYGNCLGKDGEWELEPYASRRDDKFVNNYRYDSPEEALETYSKYKDGHEGT